MSRCSTADYCSRATPLTPSRRPGAKGLNLALADVRVLADALERAVCTDSDEPLRGYTKVALARAWKRPALLGSQAASTFLAEGYTGWPT